MPSSEFTAGTAAIVQRLASAIRESYGEAEDRKWGRAERPATMCGVTPTFLEQSSIRSGRRSPTGELVGEGAPEAPSPGSSAMGGAGLEPATSCL